MELIFNMEAKQEQQLALTPQVLQSLLVLQMNTTDLYEYLVNLAMENPVIDLEFIEQAYRKRCAVRKVDYSTSHSDIGEYCADKRESEYDSLKIQLCAMKPPRKLEEIGRYLIDNLDANGYLCEPVEKTAKRLDISIELAEQALKLVHTLEPAGVGARDLRECLLLQLERKRMKDSDAWLIVKHCLDLLGSNQLPMIAKTLKFSMERVLSARSDIQQCTPRPLDAVHTETVEQYVLPDIIVYRNGETLEVEINQIDPDCIRVSPCYQIWVKQAADENIREYLSENIKKKLWVQQCLKQRKNTLCACAMELVNHQRSFFESGPRALTAFSRQEMAENLGIHESTVSRAFKGKYIQCEWGVYPADYFFSQPVSAKNPCILKHAVFMAIRDIISKEDKKKPLSDNIITAELEKYGIEISRRAVAKYREQMQIPSSSLRRKYQ